MIGKTAPNFELPDQNGDVHKLEDYKGKYVVLYFYPKDMTSGCTVEAQNFRDNLEEFKKLGVEVIGMSKDSVKRHKKFEEKEELNFTLLADEECKVVETYGVWVEKSMYGKKYMGIQRDTFVIDPEGKIVKHYEKVKPKDHVQEVLDDLRELL